MALPITPDSFLTGFGMRGTCEITDAYFAPFDYNGKSKSGFQPTLLVHYKDESGQEAKYPQPYTAGFLAAVAPSTDGETPAIDENSPSGYGRGPFLCAVKEGISALFGDSDFAVFITNLVNNGFPKQLLATGDVRPLIGLVAEFGQVQKKYVDKDGVEHGTPVSVPLKIIKLPGEKAKSAAGKTAAGAGKPAAGANGAAAGAAVAPGADIDALASAALLAALGKAGAALEIGNINPKLTAEMANVPSRDRLQAIKRAKEPEFLNALMEQGSVEFNATAGTVAAV